MNLILFFIKDVLECLKYYFHSLFTSSILFAIEDRFTEIYMYINYSKVPFS